MKIEFDTSAHLAAIDKAISRRSKASYHQRELGRERGILRALTEARRVLVDGKLTAEQAQMLVGYIGPYAGFFGLMSEREPQDQAFMRAFPITGRTLAIHKAAPDDPTMLAVLDEPGPGGAHHHYLVAQPAAALPDGGAGDPPGGAEIFMQKGPVKEAGFNGLTNEILAAIIIDRLHSFQDGPYACAENAAALTNFKNGLEWLHLRTTRRVTRGVEGTSQA